MGPPTTQHTNHMRPTLGDFELDLLGYIADHGPMSARAAFDGFGVPRGIARTTVLKTIDRLIQKEYLTRQEEGGTWTYKSLHSRAELQQFAVERFVNNTLSGNIEPFMLYLDGGATINEDDLSKLRLLVDKLEKEKKK